MKRYRLHEDAKQELREAARWLEAQEEGLGIDLLAKFDERLSLALASPGAVRRSESTALLAPSLLLDLRAG